MTAFARARSSATRRDRPAAPAGRAAARPRLERARDPRARRPPPRRRRLRRGAGADRRGRRLRLVRQPRHRPSRRGVARARPWTGSAAGSTTSRPPGGRSSWSGSAAAPRSPAGCCSTTRPGTPAPRSCYGTLPFDAGVPVDAGRLAGVPVVRRPGRRTTPVIPRELLDRTWAYLLAESGAPAVSPPRPRRARHHRGRRGRPAGWLRYRLHFLTHRTAPAAGPGTDVAGRRCPTGRLPVDGCTARRHPGTSRSNSVSDNAPPSCRSGCSHRFARCPGVGAAGPHLRARSAGLHPRRARRSPTTPSSCRRRRVRPPAPRPTTARCTSPCPPPLPPTSSPAAGAGCTCGPAPALSPGFVMVYGPRDDAELATVQRHRGRQPRLRHRDYLGRGRRPAVAIGPASAGKPPP